MKKKVTYKQSANCQNFYKAIKSAIVKNFDTLTSRVTVIGNSKEYPNSVAMPTDLFMNDYVGFARYDATGATVNQYAVPVGVLCQILDKAQKDNRTIVTRGISGIDQTIRIEWDYLVGYELSI